MDAKISETVGGFKGMLLKVVDPLFKGENGGSEIPIQISGQPEQSHVRPRQGPVFKRELVGNAERAADPEPSYSSSASTRCACTISSQGDHWKIVKRPSCEATSADASR